MRYGNLWDRVVRYVVLVALLVPPLTLSRPSIPVAASRIIPPAPLPPAAPLVDPLVSNAVPQPNAMPQSTAARAHALVAPSPSGAASLVTPPLAFVRNVGQADPSVAVEVRGSTGRFGFTPGEVTLSLPTPARATSTTRTDATVAARTVASARTASPYPLGGTPRPALPATVTHLQFDGANAAARLELTDQLPGVVNDFTGADPTRWYAQLPSYARLIYHDLYPGIDVQYDGIQGQFKSTYVVAAGADPSRIRWRYAGARAVQRQADGTIHVTLDPPATTLTDTVALSSTLTEHAAIAWQIIAGQRVPVAAQQVVAADDGIAFQVGRYDPTQPLIIDPVLSFAQTVLSGAAPDDVVTAQEATSTVAYIDGRTDDSNGLGHVVVTKVSLTTGQVLYTTYLSSGGSDTGRGIAVDDQGNAYVVGETGACTSSSGGGAFPTTAGAYQTTCTAPVGGYGYDGFLARLTNTGALGYSTYFGTNSDDLLSNVGIVRQGSSLVTYATGYQYGSTAAAYLLKLNLANTGSGALLANTAISTGGVDGLAVDAAGAAYIAGVNSSSKVVVAKYTSAGALAYQTSFGGTHLDRAWAIAVDASGIAYVTGQTLSTDFPVTSGAYKSTCSQCVSWGSDTFVAVLNSSGTVTYATYFGGSSGLGYAIGADASGNAYVAGDGGSTFPTKNALSGVSGSGAYVAKFNPSFSGNASLIYSTPMAGYNASGISVSGLGTATVAVRAYNGSANSILLTQLDGSIYPNDQAGCHCNLVHPSISQPINTRSGHYWTSVTDLRVETPGPLLAWERAYSSQMITTTSTTLGYGWQHPYGARLITPSMSGGEAGRVIVFTDEAAKYRFADTGGATLTPLPGIFATLVRASSVYTYTMRDQTQWVFDGTSGNLTKIVDPVGRRLNLTYTSGQLTQITDAADTTRKLTLTYTSGRITGVSDGTRSVGYSYDTNGDLKTVTDVLAQPTTYAYQSHLLKSITNALSQVVEQQTYDVYTSSGKVTQQTLQDGLTLQFQYLPATTVVTTTGTDGRRDVFAYDYASSNVLTGIRRNGQAVLATGFDATFSPAVVRDGNNNTTTTIFSANGLPLTTTNALGQVTRLTYDSRNNLTKQVNAQNVTALFRYDAYNNLISQTLGITTTSAVRATTLYTYTSSGTRLTDVRAPDSVVTHYDYDAAYPNRPQVNKQTVGYGTSLAQVTTFGYDTLGRVVTTTLGFGTSLARVDVTRYNPDNTIQKTIQNYKDGVFSAAKPDEDLIISYSYDALGRRTATQDVGGKYARAIHYDAKGRVDWTVQNPRDGSGNPIIPSTLPIYSPTKPDANVVTRYQYDGLGRTVLVTDTGILTGTFNATTQQFSAATTRTTRTEYDALSRPVTVTLNYQAGLSATADRNVQLLTRYDGVGNTTAQRDALGRWTTMGYDALNRVISTTVNFEDGNPATGGTDTDLTTVTIYDSLGRSIRAISNYQDGTFTTTQPLTDRITLTQYDPLGRITQTTQNAASASAPELNRVTVTAYNLATTRVDGIQDPSGRWASQQYDVLGRTTRTIQNCRNASNAAVATGCDAFNPSSNDKNVPMSSTYDVLNRTTLITDAIGVVTRMTYDGVGRTRSTIQNYVNGGPTTAITNVTTLQGYNGLGQTVVMTDATGAVSRQGYDNLGHTVVMTDAMNNVVRQGYDGSGSQRWSRTSDGRYTVVQVDGLGRVRTAIQNYQNGQADASDAVDQDRIIQTIYDAVGRRLQQIERGSIVNHVTQYAYDNRDNLIAVTENVASGTCASAPCNVITRYGYDRAGNRFKHIDANNHTRTWSYDAANEVVGATDTLNRTTGWSYDARGLVTGQIDPRGSGYNLTYAYDGVRRQRTITAGSSTNLATITWGYDSVGRRLSLADGTGTTMFRYDPLGRMTQLSAPNTGTVKYGYNARGQRTQLTYPDSTVIDYTYLNDGHLDLVKQGTTVLADYGYDNAGRLQTVAAANGATTTSIYDGLDQLRDLRTTKSGADLSRFQYGVDRRGLRTTITETLALSTTTTTGGALGTNTVGDQADSNSPGMAEAFQATATTSGAVDRLTIYIEPGNAATSVVVGLYSSGTGGSTVGSLLAQTTINSPTAGAWNTGSISSVTLTAGTTYWIAVLGPTTTGSVAFRDRTSGTNTGNSQTSSQTTLNTLPSTWSAGTTYPHAPLSAYAFLSSSGSGPVARILTNGYDGLDRLTSSVESGATSNSYSYGYDAAGNRTSVTANGTTTTMSYDAANQITNTGYVYDAVGNLTNDGSTTYTYDALNRQTTRGSTTYAYNGDGILVSQTTGGTTTRYTQDLASSLSQVLQQGSTNYVYGLTRLYGNASGTKTWYNTDTLGSVRQTINNSGVPQTILNYDPWGNVESGIVPTFGFTGELQDNAADQVYLRARWYNTARGSFSIRDPFAGQLDTPASQQQYQYAYNNPVSLVDRTGRDPWGSDQEFNSESTQQQICEATGGVWTPLTGLSEHGHDVHLCLPRPPSPQPDDPFKTTTRTYSGSSPGFEFGDTNAANTAERTRQPNGDLGKLGIGLLGAYCLGLLAQLLASLPRIDINTGEPPQRQNVVELGSGNIPDNLVALTARYPTANIYGIDLDTRLIRFGLKQIPGTDNIHLLDENYVGYTGPLQHNADVIVAVEPNPGAPIVQGIQNFAKPGSTVLMITELNYFKDELVAASGGKAIVRTLIPRDIKWFDSSTQVMDSSLGVPLVSQFTSRHEPWEVYIPSW